MKQTFCFLIAIFSSILAFANTIEVKQDGSGDFTVIQQAMDYAMEGDTILVFPGTYYENINFNGKSLTLASLLLTTGNETYKYSTIIDGGQNGSCIKVENVEQKAIVEGFTIKNGKAERGGGISISYSTIECKNNIISHNMATKWGGGIYCSFDCNLTLSGNSIFNNYTYGSGGGIINSVNSYTEFDSINRNSIYSNYAERGCDLFHTTQVPFVLYLDTCTVFQPDSYFVFSSDEYGYFINIIELDIQNYIISPYDGDLYVNPQTGSNGNSGTSWEEPLESITFAYTKIAVDSLIKNTIHLANGVYSDSTNNEKFPLNIRPFINVIGQSRDGVILDGNKNIYPLKGNNNITDYSFQRMTLQGGAVPVYDTWEIRKVLAYLYTGNDRFVLDSIVFKDSYATAVHGILSYYQADSSIVKNCEFRNNKGGHAIRTANDYGIHFINNCMFSKQIPDFDNPNLAMGMVIGDGGHGTSIIQNSLFYDNPRFGIARLTYGNTYLINCTFVNNSEMGSSAFLYTGDADMYAYNCISYNLGENPWVISRAEPPKMITSHLNIYNSLIDGGQESIHYGDQCEGDTWCKVHYDITNIDEDPIFLGMWEHPFMISDGSPCIDAGTLANLPDFIELPEFDLAGNPRIVGDSIDMGAYEWNPTIVGFNKPESTKPKQLKAAPIPFEHSTKITIDIDTQKKASVEIFDIYGQKVKTLIKNRSGKVNHQIQWFGVNDNGSTLPAGIYFVVLFYGDMEVESLKIIKQ